MHSAVKTMIQSTSLTSELLLTCFISSLWSDSSASSLHHEHVDFAASLECKLEYFFLLL